MGSWTRRDFNKTAAGFACFLPLGIPLRAAKMDSAGGFVHPGMLHGASDLQRMKQGVATKQQPLYAGFERLRDDPHSQLGYTMRGPFPEAGRSPGRTVHIQEFDSDAGASYQTALMWAITGDVSYAAIARKILNSWSRELKAITGVDAILGCGLGGFLYLNAAEILRSTGQSKEDEIAAWKKMFRDVYLPVIAEFAPFANGNWDTAALKTVMAIGIFCDDAALYNHAISYYLYGCGDGRLINYIYADGQCQESGRDQAHTQLGEGHMGDCCEMAWQQGLDLYGAHENRLLKGFEYTACYQLGGDVPFTPDTDRTGKYKHEVISVRHPKMQPIFEQIYNHYSNRMGLPAPYTERAARSIRPEGADSSAHPGFGTLTFSDTKRVSADHPGFGTLAFTRNRQGGAESAPPGSAVFGLRAKGYEKSIVLEWLPLHGRESYSVQRADRVMGPFRTTASHLSDPGWTDVAVEQSRTYFYRVVRDRTGICSLVQGATAGLPSGWRQTALGKVAVPPTSFFDGASFAVEAAGTAHSLDGAVFVSHPWGPAGAITARLVPRIASQQLMVGLMARESEGAHTAVLYLSPDVAGINEYPAWSVKISTFTKLEWDESNAQKLVLDAPIIRNGRVQGELWFRLARKGKMLQGAVSSDGRSWQQVGEVEAGWINDPSQVGLVLNSGLGAVTTEIVMDHVLVA